VKTRRGILAAFLVVCIPLWVSAQTDPPPDHAPLTDDPLTEDPLPADPLFDDPLFDDPLFDDPFAVDADAPTEPVADPFADPFAAPLEDPFQVSDDPVSGEPATTDFGGSEFIDMDDLDSLFSDSEIIDEAPADDGLSGAPPESDLLVTEGVRWGGRISGSVSADFGWDDVWTSEFGLFDPTSESLKPSLGANLFFDARPDREFRAFGKLDISTTTDGGLDFGGLGLLGGGLDAAALPEGWTSEENVDGDTEIRDDTGALIITIPAADPAANDAPEEEPQEDPGSTGSAPGLDITVFELFADYVWQDQLFFRFGKHTIKWGTGYFFSPADVLNLTAIDAEDPTADREGPISLRVQYPFGITGNAYFYTIVNTGAQPLDVAVAPKIEFAVGSGELAFGGYYQRTLAPRLVGLYSASIGEIDVFGETVLLYGSDRIFVRPSRDQSAAEADTEDDLKLVLDTYEVDDALFAQATAGFRYLKEWEDTLSLAVIGQYYFNGEGYSNDITGLLPAAVRLLANSGENGLVIDDPEEQPEGYEAPPALGIGNITNWGRHYLGLTLALSSILETNLGLTAFGLVNLSDWSGIITPAISYGFLDRFSVTASARFTFGGENGEFTDPGAVLSAEPAEPTFGFAISVSMPGGAF
jgi:hypothetical protein